MADEKDVKTPAEETVSEPSTEKESAEESSDGLFETIEMSDMTAKEYDQWRNTGELPERHVTKSQKPKADKKADPVVEAAKEKEKTEAKAEDKKPSVAKAKTEEESDPSKEKDKQKPSDEPKGERAAKRAEQLSNQIRDLLNQRKTLAAETAELEKKKAVLAESAPAKPAEEAPKPSTELEMPDVNDFETTAKYKEAMAKYLDKRERLLRAEARKEMETQIAEHKRVMAEEAEKARIKAESDRIEDAFRKQVKAASKLHADYADVALSDDIPGLKEGDIDPIMDAFVLKQQYGAFVMYVLGKDHDRAAEIRDMDRFDKVHALGKIHDQIEESLKAPAKKEETKEEDKKPPLSRAPKPPTDVSGTKKAPDDEESSALEEDNFAAYQRAANARVLASRK